MDRQLKASGLLATDATIILSGCDVGNSAKSNTTLSPTWPQILANSSGCEVFAAGGVGSGTIIDQTAVVSYDLDDVVWWRFFGWGRQQHFKESDSAYGSEDDIFYGFFPR